jgi:Lon protease-like protein
MRIECGAETVEMLERPHARICRRRIRIIEDRVRRRRGRRVDHLTKVAEVDGPADRADFDGVLLAQGFQCGAPWQQILEFRCMRSRELERFQRVIEAVKVQRFADVAPFLQDSDGVRRGTEADVPHDERLFRMARALAQPRLADMQAARLLHRPDDGMKGLPVKLGTQTRRTRGDGHKRKGFTKLLRGHRHAWHFHRLETSLMATLETSLPAEAPVMVLPNTVLFPRALMPLYIFEPRYRAMLEWALEHDRVFCMALRKPASHETFSPDDFFHTAGLGLVRACVGRDDGTSHLMLQGLSRVQFTGFSQTAPFYIARIAPLPSTGMPSDRTGAAFQQLLDLADQVRGLCAKFREQNAVAAEGLDDFLEKVNDPELLADSVAHAFLRDAIRRQDLLQETDVQQRLIALVRHLRAELNEGR